MPQFDFITFFVVASWTLFGYFGSFLVLMQFILPVLFVKVNYNTKLKSRELFVLNRGRRIC